MTAELEPRLELEFLFDPKSNVNEGGQRAAFPIRANRRQHPSFCPASCSDIACRGGSMSTRICIVLLSLVRCVMSTKKPSWDGANMHPQAMALKVEICSSLTERTMPPPCHQRFDRLYSDRASPYKLRKQCVDRTEALSEALISRSSCV